MADHVNLSTSSNGTQPAESSTSAAIAGTKDEKDMSIPEALQTYRPAVFWAVAVSLQNVMEGYNMSLTGNLIVFPAFLEKYGEYYPELGWQISYGWQMAFTLGATIGGIFGVVVGGYTIERYGARMTIMVAQTVIAGAIFSLFYAQTIQVLFAGSIINGVPWGMLATVGGIYSSEVCPTAIRAYLLNFSNLSLLVGQLIAAVVTLPFGNVLSEWAYRIPFAVQWVWPLPLFLIAFFAPDSPWWLIRRGKIEEATKALKRLTKDVSDKEIEEKIALMVKTNEYEKNSNTESSFRDCFKGTNLPRTEIACTVMAAQALTGAALAAAPTFFMLQAGLSTENSLRVNLAAMAIAILGNIFCWALMARFGQRTLFIVGLMSTGITLFVIGILDEVRTTAAIWVQAALCVVWLGLYSALVAPESYSIAGEISATRVRSHTLSLSRGVYGLLGSASGLVQIGLTNPTGVNWRGKSAYIWFGFTVIILVWAFFRLPETKGRTYVELDILFENGVKAQHFSSTKVTPRLDTERSSEASQAGLKD